MKTSYYTPVTKMSDILKDNFRKSDLLNLLGVKYGAGDDLSVMEVCNTFHININIFLHICNLYTFDNYVLEEFITGEFPVNPAIDYIVIAHDFFIRVNIAQIKEYFNDIKSTPSGRDNSILTTLFETFLDIVSEHILRCHEIFAQYRKSQKSIDKKQIEYVVGQEAMVNQSLDALIKYLSNLQGPDEFKSPVDQLKFYLIFLRSDFTRHNSFKNLTFSQLCN